MVAMTKKDAEERMRPLLGAVLDAKEVYAESNIPSDADKVINRYSEALAEANEIIRQGVA